MQAQRLVAVVIATGLGLATGCGSNAPEKLTAQELTTAVKPAAVQLSGKVGDNAVGGTGVVVDAAQGYVLTSARVIAGVSFLNAQVADNAASSGPARIRAQAPCDDLALVELVNKTPDLKALPLGNSARTRRSEHVTAFGYPAAFDTPEQQKLVVTSGAVSSAQVTAPDDPSRPRYPSVIEHQASVSAGGAGGPLVNDLGELIGINTLLGSRQAARSYAISVDRVKTLLRSLRAGMDIAYVGWELAPAIDQPLDRMFAEDPNFNTSTAGRDISKYARRLGLALKRVIRVDENKQGLYILSIDAGSPAKRAGLSYGDVITSIDGTRVKNVADVCAIIGSQRSGSRVRIDGFYLNSAGDKGKHVGGAFIKHITLR